MQRQEGKRARYSFSERENRALIRYSTQRPEPLRPSVEKIQEEQLLQ